jgi:[ribosomal protein S18]-alanine N-acetyltransferase
MGRALVEHGAVEATRRGAARLFLEVAEDNTAARALYAQTGFVEAGRRVGYYARTDGSTADALVLARDLSERLP